MRAAFALVLCLASPAAAGPDTTVHIRDALFGISEDRVFLLRRAAKTLETSRASLLADGRWELAGSSERATDCMAALHSSRAQYLACDLRLADGHVRRLLQQLVDSAPAAASTGAGHAAP